MKSMKTLALLFAGMLVVNNGQVGADVVIVDGYYASPAYYSYWYAPVEVAAAQIYAYSDLLRSEAAVNYAEAVEIIERAEEQRILNSINRVREYWKRKEVARAARLQQYISQIDRVKYGNSERWNKIKSLPELTGQTAIESGTALNFLLNRLDGTVLAYDLRYVSHQNNDETREKLALTEDIVSKLQLRQKRRGGTYYEFGASVGEALDLSWWPVALRHDRFTPTREGLGDARNALASNARDTGMLRAEDLDRLNGAMSDLWGDVRTYFTRDRIFEEGAKSWRRFHEVETFLKAFDCQIRRLEDTNDASAFTGDLRFDMERDGADLLSLLTFMAQNGLEFAPAKKGNEGSYNHVFRMMRDVYALVADEDEGIQPEKTKEDTVTPGVLELDRG